MKSSLLSTALLALALAGVAYSAEKPDLRFGNAWVRATPPNARVAGGFLRIENTGKSGDRLISASTDAAASAEIHEMTMQGDIMQMRQLTEGLAIPAKQTVTLKPGGLHLMLIAPKQAITEGQKVKITLLFEKAGSRTIEFTAHKQAPTDGSKPQPH
ncbi:MAG TPA: copper chaperone PCu(A)C [Arenimonas sp.]|nr:copper chaperone PCu(A)C [Arenimonas sp.]